MRLGGVVFGDGVEDTVDEGGGFISGEIASDVDGFVDRNGVVEFGELGNFVGGQAQDGEVDFGESGEVEVGGGLVDEGID